MKINEAELDNTLIEKIDRLDQIATSGNTGIVTFENNTFSIRQTDFLNLNKVFSMDELYAMLNHRKCSENNFLSGFDSVLIKDNNFIETSKMMARMGSKQVFQANSSILKLKESNGLILVLTADGCMYKFDKDSEKSYMLNVVDIIHKNFIYNKCIAIHI